ncbi:hypothetical protein DV736_g1563, partial [Chaetothyriales sp. CBS 134916]
MTIGFNASRRSSTAHTPSSSHASAANTHVPMAARTRTAPLRDIDFSAVGKAGRRTGITLPQQRLDEHGLEEMSHLFSSPKKPSPLKNYLLADPYEEEANNVTPKPSEGSRRTPRASVPRSASPRKSGISGTAKRASGFDIRSPKKADVTDQPDDQENALRIRPALTSKRSHRRMSSSSTKTPLRDITLDNAPANRFQLEEESEHGRDGAVIQSVEDVHPQHHESPQPQHVTPTHQSLSFVQDVEEDDGAILDDDTDGAVSEEAVALTNTLDPPALTKSRPHSVRKRKSDLEISDTSPAPKRPRTGFSRSTEATNTASTQEMTQVLEPTKPAQSQVRVGPRLKKKDTNTAMSRYQEKELDQVIERIRSRPNPPKSLYVLRRETPADDTVTRTRSGRVSFKPLAYWRNERCVWGSSPSSTGIKDGARFPLNSIKEIIRTEENEDAGPQTKKGRKGKTKTDSRSRSGAAELGDQCSDSELDDDTVDPHAEEWETKLGTFHGNVAVWDSDLQQPSKMEEEIEIAIAGAAIEKTGIKHPSQAEDDEPEFTYAKLLGNKFMGAGLVDLPPGGIKRPKNSKKMHMSFYVVKGRVTVTVGPSRSYPNKFSIGQGGFWQEINIR